MKEARFRIIYNGLIKGAQLKQLVPFLKREFDLNDTSIRALLRNPPRTILHDAGKNEAEEFRTVLESMGCRMQMEPIMSGIPEQFNISAQHYRTVKKELSKILRVCSCLALVLVQLDELDPEWTLPSLMGDFQDKVAEYLRESDTVIGIDDNRLIVLGFSTNNEGIYRLQDKVTDAVRELLGTDVAVSSGVAMFPREGKSFTDLLQIAELKRTLNDLPDLSESHPQASLVQETKSILTKDAETIDAIQLCFEKGRGKLFKRLLTMDSQTLYAGLSQIPQTKQKEFLARLPCDSSIIPGLEELILHQPEPIVSDEIKQTYEAIYYQMQMEKELEDRNDIQKKIQVTLSNTEVLPTLPAVATQVFHIASNPNSSASDLSDVIKLDQALTSKLLKVVNSAFYGFRQKIGTVNHAVVILGLDDIINLAIGLSAARVINVQIQDDLYNPKTLWHHSIGTAIIAHKLCEKFPEYQKKGIFTAGLLHDFGKIILIDQFSDLYASVHENVTKYELPIFELEEDTFGLSHAAIGKLMATNWNMPDYLVEAIAFHHRPNQASRHPVMAAVVGLADYLYHEALKSGEFTLDVSDPCNQLTFGHRAILEPLFPEMDPQNMGKMVQDAIAIIQDNQDAFDILY
jgi:putative nucleotidyltransferase with HDIG domain